MRAGWTGVYSASLDSSAAARGLRGARGALAFAGVGVGEAGVSVSSTAPPASWSSSGKASRGLWASPPGAQQVALAWPGFSQLSHLGR